VKEKREPRIAFVDIETAPSIGAFFDLWKEGNIVWTVSSWYILSFAVKWSDESKVKTFALPDYPIYNRDRENDKDLALDLWRVFDDADIICAHNGDRFDIRKSNARFVFHGFKPPATYRTIDTLKVAKRHFKFDSNRLNELGQYLGVGKKIPHTGADLWRRCIGGDPSAWKVMRKYNAQDVKLLENVYELLKPWMTSHPNLNVYTGSDGCPKCHSHNIQKRGYDFTQTRQYQRFRCLDCGGWFKGETIKKA